MRIIGAYICLMVIGCLTSIAGIGGGAVILPVYYIVADYSLQESLLLAVLTVAGSAISRVIYYLGKTQRTGGKSLIQYDLLRLIIPFDTATAAYGFILNLILPNWVVLVVICLIMSTVLVKTYKKTRKVRRLEQLRGAPDVAAEASPSVARNFGEFGKNLKYLILYLFFILAQSYLIQLKIFKEYCNWYYWLQTGCFTLLNLLVGWWLLPTLDQAKSTTRQIIFFALQTGWLSTLLGIGGGMLINPLLLHHDYLPEHIVATTSITIFFSALTSSLQRLSENTLEWYHLAGALLAGLISSGLAMVLNQRYIKRKSLIFVFLTIIITISFIVITLSIGIEIIQDGFEKFQNLCDQ